MIEAVALWATIAGTLIALLAIAWAAVNYVLIRSKEIKHQEYQKFFEVMDHLGAPGHSIASKMAAAYELRKYPQYRDVIVRLAQQAQYEGAAAGMLKAEMDLTAQHLATVSKP